MIFCNEQNLWQLRAHLIEIRSFVGPGRFRVTFFRFLLSTRSRFSMMLLQHLGPCAKFLRTLFFMLSIPVCFLGVEAKCGADSSRIVGRTNADDSAERLSTTTSSDHVRFTCAVQRLEGEVTSAGLNLTSLLTNRPADLFRVEADF